MSDNLKAEFHKILTLASIPNARLRQTLLNELSKDLNFCRAIREIVLNVRDRNVKLSPKQQRRITTRHQHTLTCLCMKQKSKRRFKTLVKQTGRGFFLPIVIPLVAEVIRNLVSKK